MVIRGRVVAPIAATLFACSVVVALQPQDVGFSSVQSFVNEARATQGLPGLAVVVVRSDGQPQVYVGGERRIGKGDPITPADRAYVAYATIQASRDVAVGAFTNLGGGQDLRDAVAKVALQIATQFSTNKKSD